MALLNDDWRVHWVCCLALDASGRWLEGDGEGDRLACDDFRHPYAHAIRRGESLRLDLGEARSRLDHPDFQAQVAELSPGWQLWVQPLRARGEGQEWLGVLALAAPPAYLDTLLADEAFLAFDALLCHLWVGQVRQHDRRRRHALLSDSLAKLNDDARRRTLNERLRRDILGDSPAIDALRDQMVRAAETKLAVLIQGETGTGKDLVARGIHELSGRAGGPFLAINCAAIPESLLEAELFGHAKGAFSGADRERRGLVGEAHGGTLFLDEIGDMPLALQAKLLRVLESGCYRPLGSAVEQRVDLRLVAATHQPLHRCIREGGFRADLYYRLGQFPLTLPSLAARREDIPQLVETFIDDFCRREGREDIGLGRAALTALMARDYPGNVRELKNLIDYACAMTRNGEDITPEVLPAPRSDATEEDVVEGSAMSPNVVDVAEEVGDLRRALRDYEARLIRQRLNRFSGNCTLAAESLGLPRRTLANKCRKLQLDSP
ncbi:sigma 54-interacting transcriptional regulator [Halomonas sp. 328]|nr:sigma 54-interacting transcriptional regulator [Halomonas sp. 328]